MAEIFKVDFETGDLSQFSNTDVGTNTSTVDATAAKTGSYGWHMVHGGADMVDAFGYVTMSSETEAWFGFHINVLDSNLSAYGSSSYFTLLNSSFSQILNIKFEDSTGNGIPDRYRIDGSGLTLVRTTTNFSLSTWHWIEVHYKAGTGADGEVQIWIDDSQVKNETGLNLSANTFLRAIAGFDGTTPTAGDEWYLDNFISDDAGRVPEPTSGTTYNESITEAANPSDLYSGTLSYNLSLSDTAAPTDSYSGLLNILASFSDTATAVDLYGTSIDLLADVSESANPTDVYSSGASILDLNFSDTASPTDDYSATYIFNITLSDTATATDILDSIAEYGVDVSEIAEALDSYSSGDLIEGRMCVTISGVRADINITAISGQINITAVSPGIDITGEGC